MSTSFDPSKPMIQLKNISLIYELYYSRENNLKGMVMNFFHRRNYVEKKKDSFAALEDISLTIQKGERVGIIGKNGAGKSTMLKVMAGIIKPQKGELFVNGPTQPLIEVGAGFNPELSGRENIFLNGYMMGFSRAELREKEAEIVEFTELGDFIDVPIKYYSSGMSVRLAFAIATCIDPHILLFDEMLSAGDAGFQEKAAKRLNALIDQARCIVLVSHDLGLISSFCHRVLVIHDHKIAYDGDPATAIEVYRSLMS